MLFPGHEVVQERRRKSRLVSRVEDVQVEQLVDAIYKLVVSADELLERGDIVRSIHAVDPGVVFIVCVSPVASSTVGRILREERAIGKTGNDEPTVSIASTVLIPLIPPVSRPLEILVRIGGV